MIIQKAREKDPETYPVGAYVYVKDTDGEPLHYGRIVASLTNRVFEAEVEHLATYVSITTLYTLAPVTAALAPIGGCANRTAYHEHLELV